MLVNYNFVKFDKALHSRDDFDCGVGALNDYIGKSAGQQQDKNLTTVYVCCMFESSIPKPILGYYTLSANSISSAECPEKLVRSLPRNYSVPTIKIGRLARDKHKTKSGFGGIMLWDALYRALEISRLVGALAVDVDAKNDKLVTFYKQHGFLQLQQESSCLILPIKTLERALQESVQHEEALL